MVEGRTPLEVSKEENHRYLLGIARGAAMGRKRPRLWQLGVMLVVLAVTVLAAGTGALQRLLDQGADSPELVPVISGAMVVLSVTAGLVLRRRRQARGLPHGDGQHFQ